MATFDSTVRLRQLNKPELSGYIVEVIGDIPNTGELVNSFYPLNSNPNSYVTSGQTGIFTTRTDLDSNYLSTLIYVGNNYYPLNNPSGYVSSLNSSIVYTTGYQNIDSLKNFNKRPTVNTTGVLLIGEISGQNLGGDASGLYYETENNTLKFKSLKAGNNIQIIVDNESLLLSVTGVVGNSFDLSKSNVVYLTGAQTISGNKIFKSGLSTSNLTSNSSTLSLSGNSGARIEFYNNSYITGFSGIHGAQIYENGIRVATAADLEGILGFDIQNVVYRTGDQTINGFKNFLKIPTVNGTGVLLQNENVVYTTGNQIVSGDKTFNNIYITGSEFLYKTYFPKISTFNLDYLFDNNSYYLGIGSYQFTIYGVKIFENKKYFSDPIVSNLSTVTNNNQKYSLRLNWIKDSFYDQYFIAVNKDPKFSTPINDLIENTNYGFYLDKNIVLPIYIGDINIPGTVSDPSSTQVAVYQIEKSYKNKYFSEIYGATGNLILKSTFLQLSGQTSFDQRPTVNGTGVLLSGEAGNITISGIGNGYQIYSGYSEGNYNFRSISGGTGLNISLSNDKKVLNLNTTGLVAKTDTGNFVTTGQTGNFLTTYSNVVYVDGNQTISGNKTFQNALILNTQATQTNHAVKASRTISAGVGLEGGGNLILDRQLTVKPNYGISVSSNGVSINDEVVVTTTKEQDIFENKKIYGKLKDFSIDLVPDPDYPDDAVDAKYSYGQNSLFSFYVYEYKDENGRKIYSKPIHFYRASQSIPDSLVKFYASFSWPKSETASGYHILVDQDLQAGITNGLLNPASGIIIPNKNITGIEVGKISGIGYVTSRYDLSISGYYQDFRYLGIPDFNYSNALDVIGNFKVNSGSFDVNSKINYSLPPLTTEKPGISFSIDPTYQYNQAYDFIFYLYGYKTVEGEAIYSNPIQFTGFPKIFQMQGINYLLKMEWTPNSFYDGYTFLVDQDIPFGISGGIKNEPRVGALFLDKSQSSITIGEFSGENGPYGYISELSDYYVYVYPDLKYSKSIGSEIHITTGIDHKIIISGQTLFNKRPMVNGTGVLLSGEVVGNNVNIENVVYTTGTQTVVGKKTFSNVLSANVLKTNWIISEDNVQYGQPGALSNFIGERAGFQDNSSVINYVNFIGYEAGFDIRGINNNSNLIGNSAGLSSNNIESSNFIGYQAGLSTNNSYDSNFIGYQAGLSSYQNIRSNFIGYLAGGGDESSSNYDSNYIGNQAGYYSSLCPNSNFIGYEAGAYATVCSYSNFLGNGAGAGSVGSTSSIFIGNYAGNSTFNCFNSIFIGKNAGYQNIYYLPSPDSFSFLIGNYTSGKLNSIAIGQGAANSLEKQLNLANVIYATNINTGIVPSSTPVLNGKVGILNDNPQYTLDVSGDCRITGQTVFAVRPTVNGSGVSLQGEGGGPSSDISIYQIRFFT